MTERENKACIYEEASSLDTLGYFRLHNACELYTFDELEKKLKPTDAKFFRKIRELTGKKAGDVPIEFDLLPRPEDEVSIEEIHLSLAEVAGGAAAIKFLTERDSVFFGPTRLGSFAKRWFHIINIDNPPHRETDAWMEAARGEKGLKKLDEAKTVPFRTSKTLFRKFGIEIVGRKGFRAATLGTLTFQTDEQTSIVSDKNAVNRESLHTLIGFSKIFYVFAVTRSSETPYVNLVGKPFIPFSELTGITPIENIIKIDKIKAYHLIEPKILSKLSPYSQL